MRAQATGCLCEHAILQTPGHPVVHDSRCEKAPRRRAPVEGAELRVTLAMRTREARQALGLTLTDAAERAGVTKGQLSEVESGASGLGALALYRLARTYGVRMEWLLGVEPIGPPPALEFKHWPPEESDALALAVVQFGISPQDARALARVSYRGRRPTEPSGWWFIHESIRRSL